MPTATATKPTTKRPTQRKFLTTFAPEVQSIVKLATEGFSLTPSPSGSYARVSRDGVIVAYAIPGRRGVRFDVPTIALNAPAKLQSSADPQPGSHGRAKCTVLAPAASGQTATQVAGEAKAIRSLLDWLLAQRSPAPTT